VSVSLRSIAPPLTTTRSASALPGDGDGVGLGVAVAVSCAMAMLAPKSNAVAAVKTFFIEIFKKWIFQVVIGYCLRD
jgi:hypothetical protein